MSAVDLVIGLYLALHAIRGWQRGLMASLVGLVSIVLSTVVAATLCRPAAVVLNGCTGVVGSVSKQVQRILGHAVQQTEYLEAILEAVNLGTAVGEAVSSGARAAADAVAWLLVTSGCFVVLLIVIRLTLGALADAVCSPLKSGPAATLNKLAGSAFGCIVGLVHVAVAWFGAMLLASLGAIEPEWVESSVLLQQVGRMAAAAVSYVVGKWT